jgi:hypothetical protein
MHRKTQQCGLVLALIAALALPAWSDPVPAGSEFRVNLSPEVKQSNSSGAVAPNGRTLLVWENFQLGLRGRFFNPDGSPATGELALVPNQHLASGVTHGVETLRVDPFAAFLPNGEFLLAWTEERDDVTNDILEQRLVLDRDVYLQRFTGAGQKIGQPAQVNPAGPGFQNYPRLLVRGNQPTLVVWQSDARDSSSAGDGVFGRFATKAVGRPYGATFKVSLLPGLAGRPAVAGLPNGKFLVVWHQDDGQGLGVFARAFTLTPQGLPDPASVQVRINSDLRGEQSRPAVAARGAADYLVVWQGQGDSPSESHVFGRFVAPNGDLAAKIVQVSQHAGTTQISPSIAHFQNGNFLVTWLDYLDNAPLGVFGVTLDGKGNRKGAEIAISQQRIGAHFRTAIAASDSSILIPYESYLNLRNGITARRLVP